MVPSETVSSENGGVSVQPSIPHHCPYQRGLGGLDGLSFLYPRGQPGQKQVPRGSTAPQGTCPLWALPPFPCPVSCGLQVPHSLLQFQVPSGTFWCIPGEPSFLSIPRVDVTAVMAPLETTPPHSVFCSRYETPKAEGQVTQEDRAMPWRDL